jgi:hypothetical protein
VHVASGWAIESAAILDNRLFYCPEFDIRLLFWGTPEGGLLFAVGQREPRALHLNHDPVAPPECVVKIGHLDSRSVTFPGLNGSRG